MMCVRRLSATRHVRGLRVCTGAENVVRMMTARSERCSSGSVVTARHEPLRENVNLVVGHDVAE